MNRFFCSISLLSFISFSGISYASDTLKGRAETNFRYGTERSILMTEFWVPLLQHKEGDAVLFADLRLMGDDQDAREGNIALGYRHIGPKVPYVGKGIMGIQGWFDRRITERGTIFHQMTGSLEWLGEKYDLRLNGYHTLSPAKSYTIANADPQPASFSGTSILVDTNGTLVEESLDGFDLELGMELGQDIPFIEKHTDSLRVYGGAYVFEGEYTERISGWRTRIAADITSDFQIGARFQHDDERGSQGFLEATIRFPFGAKKSFRKEGLRARMDESPERDIDIVTGEVVTDPGDRIPVVNKETGQTQQVIHVDNSAAAGGDGSAERPYNTLSDAENAAWVNSIIYVHEGTGTDLNQDSGIQLNYSGQQLIGSGVNFYYDSASFTTANGSTPSSILLAEATSAPVISNAGDVAVRVNSVNSMVAGIEVENADHGILTRIGDNITISDVTIHDMTSIGVLVVPRNGAQMKNATLRNVTVYNAANHGIFIGANGDGAQLDYLSASNITVYDSGSYGVNIQANNGGSIGTLELENMIIYDNPTGLLVNSRGDSSIDQVYLRDIELYDNTSSGLYVLGVDTSVVNYLSIDNLNIHDNAIGVGIYASANSTLSEIMMQNSKVTDSVGRGIYVLHDSDTDMNIDLGGGSLGSIGQNSIYDNGGDELDIDYNDKALKAENNWWGSTSGLDLGDTSTTNAGDVIDATPFLTSDPND